MLNAHPERLRRPTAAPLARAVAHRAAACSACAVRHSAVCGALGDDELRALEALQTKQKVAPGQAIFFEDDPADAVYTVTAGTVRLSKLLPDGRRQVTGFLIAGDFFGLVSRDVYPSTAEAVGEVAVCRIERRAFGRLCERFPRLALRLLARAVDELAGAQEQMLLLGRRTPREKLAHFLLHLRQRLAAIGEDDETLPLPMKRSDLADFLGITIETLSRTFTALRKEGLIALPDPQEVVFRDLDAIEEMAA